MSLKSVYQSYLAAPNASALSDNASLNYITTLTTINTAVSIAKHNAAHKKVLTKKQEKVLDCVEGSNAITLDVEITLEFLSGGGAYLPGLDDNFVSDRVVTFPMIHIVHFDGNQKIQQIRLYWDQGSLLKQIDVIGARARNWPIRDGVDQVRLVKSSASHTTNGQSPPPPASREPAVTAKPRSQSNNVTRDPHATLALFAPRDEDKDDAGSQREAQALARQASAKPPPRDYQDLFVGNDSIDNPPAVEGAGGAIFQKSNQSMRPPPPKAQTAKPPPRDYHDLFVGNESDASPVSAKGKAISPSKDILSPGAVAPKGGAGKNYQPSRLFDATGDDPNTPGSPSKSAYKPHPKKYDHFTFGNGEDGPEIQIRPRSKHQNQWDFEDFTTPVKPNKIRDQDKRHFGWEDDEPVMDSPVKHPNVPKPRPDANPQFEFQDDGTPAGDRRPAGQPRGAGNVRTTGLYQNHLFDEAGVESPEKTKKPLATVTNLQERRKDFDPHFEYTDSPSADRGTESSKPISEARAKVVKDLGANWEANDQSPASQPKNNDEAVGDKENLRRGNDHIGIKSGGDGMGGKKGVGRNWGFGSDSGDEESTFQASKKQQAPKENRIWDF